MDKSDIISLPNPHLRQRSRKVSVISDEIKQLIKDMEQATLSWEDSRQHEVGVALAAVQVDCLDRLVIIRNNFNDKADRSFQVYLNPKITKKFGDIVEDYEGCLSIKDTYGKVARHSKIKVLAKNLQGEEVRLTAEGFLARVFQHEIDHTNGIVFVDHIKDQPDNFYRLGDDGSLKQLDYKKTIENNPDLWVLKED